MTSRPRVMAEARTFAEADEALWMRLIGGAGDGENLRDYDPPAPSQPPQLPPEPEVGVVQISPNAIAHLHEDPAHLFETYCRFCRSPRGARTSTPLVVECFDTVAEGAFTAALPYPSPPYLQIVSERFLTGLTPSERRAFEWRPVTAATGRPRKKYYEAIPKRFVPFVRVKGVYNEPLITCDRCGRPRTMALTKGSLVGWHFVCGANLQRPLPGLFAVGSPDDYRLCMRSKRWTAMRGSPAGRGWLPQNLGIVSSKNVERRPTRVALSVKRHEEKRAIRNR